MTIQPKKVQTIVIHPKAHLDEIWAITMLKAWGEKHFPGIADANILADGTGGKTFDGTNAEKLLDDGFLLLGIGGGMFDEHPTVGNNGKQGECTSTLVAKYLGIADEPSLQKVMEYVMRSDLKAKSDPFGIASVVKAMNEDCPTEEVVEWGMKALLAKCRQQKRFLEAQDVYATARVEEIPIGQGRTTKMVTAKTNNTEFHKFARSQGCGIIVQQSSSNTVQILTDKKLGLDMRDVARVIRLEEQWAEDDVQTIDWKALEADGKVAGADNWFFQQEAGNLFNGSTSHPDVLPSRIPLGVIQDVVRLGLNSDRFEKNREATCKTGVCKSTRNDECPWYALGLRRCRKIRYEQSQKKAE